MEAAASTGFVGEADIRWQSFAGGHIANGTISCQGGILITIAKELEVVNHETNEVSTVTYTYSASVQGRGVIFRHDNSDHHGHPDPHHRHDYNWKTNEELADSPVHVGRANWPTLGQFIEMARRWYLEHRGELPDPDGYAKLPEVPYVFLRPPADD